MMMEMDGQKATTGERVTAAGLDVITAPVQIVMVVVVFGGLWVMQIPTMVMGGSGDETASPVNVEQNQQQEEPVAVE